MNYFRTLLMTQNPAKMAQEQAVEASLLALHHQAQAEFHKSLAEMYTKRVARLPSIATSEG